MRKHLIWVLGLVVAAGSVFVASLASAAPNVQTITGTVAPKKLPASAPGKPVSLDVDVSATNPGNPNQLPNPTTLAKVDFDKDLKIQQKGLETCDPTAFTAATTTQQAKDECDDSQIGDGSSTIKVPTGPSTPPLNVTALVTAFNGASKTLVLHTYNSLSGAQTLVGSLAKADAAAGSKYGTTLTVPVPPLAGGTAVITQFQAKVKEVYNFGGKRRSLVASTCKDKKLDFQARFTDDQGQEATGTDTQKCTKKKAKKKKKKN